MEQHYQEINFTYSTEPMEGLNHKVDVYINLVDDYSLYDIFDAFVTFCSSIGFSVTRTDVLERLREYSNENLPNNSNVDDNCDYLEM